MPEDPENPKEEGNVAPQLPGSGDVEAPPPPPLQDGLIERVEALEGNASRGALASSTCLGIFIGLTSGFLGLFTLCCLPALRGAPAVRNHYLLGLVPAVILNTTLWALIIFGVIHFPTSNDYYK